MLRTFFLMAQPPLLARRGNGPETPQLSYDRAVRIQGLEVIFEDDSILVVNKPAGMLTIATETEKAKTAYALLRAYLNNKKRPEKLFIVHRLDREASGLLVFAKTIESKERLQDQFKDHSAGRRYAAVVEGSLSKNQFTLQSYLAENSAYRVYSTPNRKIGKLAVTHVKVLKRTSQRSFSEVRTRDRTETPDPRASRRTGPSHCWRQILRQPLQSHPTHGAARNVAGFYTPRERRNDVASFALSERVREAIGPHAHTRFLRHLYLAGWALANVLRSR